MKKLQLEQNTTEWHEFRKNHIGSSDAPVIMNLSPWRTPYQLWREKLDLIEGQFETNSMRRGKELEPQARYRASLYLEEELEPAVCVSSKYEWMAASLDGLSKDGKIAIEIKHPNKEDHLQALNNIVPEKYLPQLLHIMEDCELEYMYYQSCYCGEDKFLKVYRDDAYIKRMIEEEAKFWQCLQTLCPPPFGDKDFIEREDFEWFEGAKEWLETKKTLKDLEEKEQKQRQYLIQLAENQSCKGNGVTLTKIVRKGNIDFDRVIEEKLKGVNLEPYRKNNIETWRIGVN